MRHRATIICASLLWVGLPAVALAAPTPPEPVEIVADGLKLKAFL